MNQKRLISRCLILTIPIYAASMLGFSIINTSSSLESELDKTWSKAKVFTGEETLMHGHNKGGEHDKLVISIPHSTLEPTVYISVLDASGVEHFTSESTPRYRCDHTNGRLEVWLGEKTTSANWHMNIRYAVVIKE